MKKNTVQIFYILLIFLIVGCNSQPMTETQQIASTPTVKALPMVTLLPTSLGITSQNVSLLKLESTIGLDNVNDVAWSPLGNVIAVVQDFNLLFYDSSSLQLIGDVSLGGTEVVFSPDGLVAVIAQDKKIIFWDIKKEIIIKELVINIARIDHVLYSPTGTSLAILGDSRITEGDPNSVIELWNVESWKKVYVNSDTWDANIAFSPDGDILALLSNAGFIFIQSTTGEQQKEDLTWEGGSLAYISEDILLKRLDYSHLKVVDARTFETLNLIDVEGSYSEFVVSPDKKKIVFPNIWDVTQVWDLENESLMYELDYYSDVARIDFSPDSKYFISTSYDGYIRIHDLETGRLIN